MNDLVYNLLYNPPSLLIAVVIAILVGHAIETLKHFLPRKTSHNGLIPIVEMFLIFVLGFLTLHAYLEGVFKTEKPTRWFDSPFSLAAALVLFGIGSIALYKDFRQFEIRTQSRKASRSGRLRQGNPKK